MKIETILSAAVITRDLWVIQDLKARLGISPRDLDNEDKLLRQYHAFRDRIIRMDEEKDEEIAKQKYLKEAWHEAYNNLFFHRKRGSQ